MSATSSPSKGFRDVVVVQERQREAENKHLQRSLQAKKKALAKSFQENQSRHQSTSPVRRRKLPEDSRDTRTKSEPRSPRAPHILPAFSNHSLIEKYLVECARTMNKKDFNEEEWKLANQIRNTTSMQHKRPFLRAGKGTPKRSVSQPGARLATPERSSSLRRTTEELEDVPPSSQPGASLYHKDYHVPLSLGTETGEETELMMNMSVSVSRSLTPPPIQRTSAHTVSDQIKSRGLTPPRYIRSTAEKMSLVRGSEESLTNVEAHELANARKAVDLEATRIVEEERALARRMLSNESVDLSVGDDINEAKKLDSPSDTSIMQTSYEEAVKEARIRAETEIEKYEKEIIERKRRAEAEIVKYEEEIIERKRRAEIEIEKYEQQVAEKKHSIEVEFKSIKEAHAERIRVAESDVVKAEEDAAVRKHQAEMVAKQAKEEAAGRRARAEAAAKKAEREINAKRAKEETSEQVLEAEFLLKKLQVEAEAKRTEEEAATRKFQAELSIRCLEEELSARKLQAERRAKQIEDEAVDRSMRADAAAKRVEEEALARRLAAEEQARLAEEYALQRREKVNEESKKLEEIIVDKKHHFELEVAKLTEDAESRKRQLLQELKLVEEDAAAKKRQAQSEALQEEEDAAVRKLQAEYEAKKAEEEADLRKLAAEHMSLRAEEECSIRRLRVEEETHQVAQLEEETLNRHQEHARMLEQIEREKQIEKQKEEEEREQEEQEVSMVEQEARKLLEDHEVNLMEEDEELTMKRTLPPSPPAPQRLSTTACSELTGLSADLDSVESLASQKVKKLIRKKQRVKSSALYKSPLKLKSKPTPSPNTPHTDKEEVDTDSSWTLTGESSEGRTGRSRVRLPPPAARDSSHSSQSLGGFEDLDTSISPIRSSYEAAPGQLLVEDSVVSDHLGLEEVIRISAANHWSQSSVSSNSSSEVSSSQVGKHYFLGRWGYWLLLVFTAATLTIGSAFIGLSHIRDPRTTHHSQTEEKDRVEMLSGSSELSQVSVLAHQSEEIVSETWRSNQAEPHELHPRHVSRGTGSFGQLRSVIKSTSQHPLVTSDITREIVGVSMNRKLAVKQLRRLRVPLRVALRYMGKGLMFTRRWATFILRPLYKARILPIPILLAFVFMSAL